MSDEPYNDTGNADLRDRIAIAALIALGEGWLDNQDEHAKWCYEMADAMLKARERKEVVP